MWQRDVYVAQSRIAERELAVRDAIRVRRMLGDVPLPGSPTRPAGRRLLAEVFASSGRAAFWVARHIDAAVG